MGRAAEDFNQLRLTGLRIAIEFQIMLSSEHHFCRTGDQQMHFYMEAQQHFQQAPAVQSAGRTGKGQRNFALQGNIVLPVHIIAWTHKNYLIAKRRSLQTSTGSNGRQRL